jgi:hypothetical protein
VAAKINESYGGKRYLSKSWLSASMRKAIEENGVRIINGGENLLEM